MPPPRPPTPSLLEPACPQAGLATQSAFHSAKPGVRAPRLQFVALLTLAAGLAFGEPAPQDPLFDLGPIMTDPTETSVLSTEVTNGIVFQTLEFTTRLTNGAPERIQGILAFPEGGKSLPGVFWSMGGMAAASRGFPGLLASNGYACLAVTLPHKLRNSFRTPFDATHPEAANLTLLARDQLRGITVLSQRPEVDPARLAVAGASYGGVFATLIAGVDPRIKAGFSFFGGGHHALGTSLPQFLKMGTPSDRDVWNRTIDPAFRLKTRAIPFLWGVAFNDHWFLFPAVTKTFLEAAGTDKRIAILPHWQHGFPPEVDKALFEFLDTTPVSAHPRPAYNSPGPVRVSTENGQAIASFSWTGDRPAAKAELVVSYGEDTPWLGWPNRASFIFPASISGQCATARLPIPSHKLPLIVWGNLTDTSQVLVSTPPLTLSGEALAALPAESNLVLNGFPDSGEITNRPFSVPLFFNVPGLAHRLTVRIKAAQAARFTVTLTPVRPLSWGSAVVRDLVAKDPRLAPLLPRWADPVEPITVTAPIGTAWQDVTLEIPKPAAPVDGYRLTVDEMPQGMTPYWIDTIRMQPVWPDGSSNRTVTP